MTKYGRLQILKHALEYYIQRENATLEELKVEKSILKQITNELDQFKQQYHIQSKTYTVIHAMGSTWEFECSSEKSAKRRGFRDYKKHHPDARYQDFLREVQVKAKEE